MSFVLAILFGLFPNMETYAYTEKEGAKSQRQGTFCVASTSQRAAAFDTYWPCSCAQLSCQSSLQRSQCITEATGNHGEFVKCTLEMSLVIGVADPTKQSQPAVAGATAAGRDASISTIYMDRRTGRPTINVLSHLGPIAAETDEGS